MNPPGTSVYGVRMARVNITIPDELVDEARKQGLNVSRLASGAVAFELDRLRKIAMLDVYLAEMEAELGPIRAEERAEAEASAKALEAQLRDKAARGQDGPVG